MEIPDIKTVNELLDFVLTECGNSTFQYYSHNRELDMHEVGVLNLEFLYCSDNHKLKKLPELPKNLKKLICCDSNLIELPELPDTLE